MALSSAVLSLLRDHLIASSLAAGLAVILLAHVAVALAGRESKEPPALPQKVPFVGHLVSMLRYSHRYADMNFEDHALPAHTLSVLGGKLYIVNSPKLAEAVLRNRSLSFEPFVRDFMKGATNIDSRNMKIFESEEFSSQWIKILYASMTGSELLKLNVQAIRHFGKYMAKLPTDRGFEVENFYIWVRNTISNASTTSLYGSHNPLSDPRLVEAYWDFEADLHILMTQVFTSMTAPKAHQARLQLTKAFDEYYRREYDASNDVPRFTKDRMTMERKYGMSAAASGAIELAVIHGALFNTALTTYWLVTFIFNQPELVSQLREEVSSIVIDESDREKILQVNRIEKNCPLFMSCFRETQRCVFLGTLNRRVMADTDISDGRLTYTLRKGQNLQVPVGVLHKSRSIWGDDADEFVPDRFLDDEEIQTLPSGFLPFGGGKHICPGRNFASGEILGCAALLLLSYDMTAVDGGPVKVPETAEAWPTAAINKPAPDEDVGVLMKRRKGWEKVDWTVVDEMKEFRKPRTRAWSAL
ncbi:cytochrome P450 [Stachybotrys elegans]|uniref:Cytochrome P450 n=1 Tax=Stachybotrys elegans TaxID=80388 RepID=A0A8K0WPQ3_9HYPO|nr:cytochrome P450 [Stachybotrys elegans]